MNFSTPDSPLYEVLEKIRAVIPGDIKVYLVGGAVRDLLRERATRDLDFVIFSGDVLKHSRRIADALGGAYYPLDVERETARVILDRSLGPCVLDFAAPRGADLNSDLAGRDFSINAIAIDLSSPNELIDPIHGARDLGDNLLRACSSMSMIEDPVRILRAVRLSLEIGLHIVPETKVQVRLAVPALADVSIERRRDELFRILEGNRPATAIRLLDIFNALNHILPELLSLKGIDQPLHHRYNLWDHTLAVTQKLNSVLNTLTERHDPESTANWALGLVSIRLGRYRKQIHHHLMTSLSTVRPMRALLMMAALYHDSGKPQAMSVDVPGEIHFYGHESIGADIASNRANQLRLSNGEIRRLRTIVKNHMRPLFLAQSGKPPSRRAIYRFFRDCGEAGVDICLLALADTLGTYGPELPQDLWSSQLDTVRVLLSAYWENNEKQVDPPALLSGHDLIQEFKLMPGPEVGELLAALKEEQAMGELNDRQDALRFAEAWLSK